MKSAALLVLLVGATALAAPPKQSSVEVVLGPKGFRDNDVIEITDVRATSPRLEKGDTVTVRGRYRLHSVPAATLALYTTQFEGTGATETDPTQLARVKEGQGKFELRTTITHRGALHLSFYGEDGNGGIGCVYFGTAEQMKDIVDWDVAPKPIAEPTQSAASR